MIMVKLNPSDRVFDITSKYTVNLLNFWCAEMEEYSPLVAFHEKVRIIQSCNCRSIIAYFLFPDLNLIRVAIKLPRNCMMKILFVMDIKKSLELYGLNEKFNNKCLVYYI